MRRRRRPPPPGHRSFRGASPRSPGGPAATIGYDPAMWLTLLHGGTAALFLAMTAATLFHARWARRLPPLASLDPPPRTGGVDEGGVANLSGNRHPLAGDSCLMDTLPRGIALGGGVPVMDSVPKMSRQQYIEAMRGQFEAILGGVAEASMTPPSAGSSTPARRKSATSSPSSGGSPTRRPSRRGSMRRKPLFP